MNNKEINKLKSRIAVVAALKIFLFSLLGMVVILILVDVIFQDILANLVNNYNQLLYIYFKVNK